MDEKNTGAPPFSVFLSEGEKRTIYEDGRHVTGAFYERVYLQKNNGVYYYTYEGMTDPMNAGGYTKIVPGACLCTNGQGVTSVDAGALLVRLNKY